MLCKWESRLHVELGLEYEDRNMEPGCGSRQPKNMRKNGSMNLITMMKQADDRGVGKTKPWGSRTGRFT